jgi:hypothetical protein
MIQVQTNAGVESNARQISMRTRVFIVLAIFIDRNALLLSACLGS